MLSWLDVVGYATRNLNFSPTVRELNKLLDVIKVKLFLSLIKQHRAMKTYWGSEGIAPRILSPWHYMEVSVQFHAPSASPQGRSLRYPLDRRLGGPQSRSGRGVKEKNSQLRSSDRPSRSQSLYRLSHPCP